MTNISTTAGSSFNLATCIQALNHERCNYLRISKDKLFNGDSELFNDDISRRRIEQWHQPPIDMFSVAKATLKNKFPTQWDWLTKNCSGAIVVDDNPNNIVLYLVIPQKCLDESDLVEVYKNMETFANSPDLKEIMRTKLGLNNIGLVTFLFDSLDCKEGSSEPVGLRFEPYGCANKLKLELLGASGENVITQPELAQLTKGFSDVKKTAVALGTRQILSEAKPNHLKWVVDAYSRLEKKRPKDWEKVQEVLSKEDHLHVNPIKDPRQSIADRWDSGENAPLPGDDPRKLFRSTVSPASFGFSKYYKLAPIMDEATFIDERQFLPPLENGQLAELAYETDILEEILPANVISQSVTTAKQLI